MINYAFYNSEGKYIQSGVSSEGALASSDIPAGCSVYYGIVNIALQYHNIETNTPVNMPQQPQDGFVFNYTTKSWEPDTSYLDSKAKYQRNQLLVNSDWTQIPNNPLTQAKQIEWETYRQQLRDITSQQGYPVTVTWPTPPN